MEGHRSQVISSLRSRVLKRVLGRRLYSAAELTALHLRKNVRKLGKATSLTLAVCGGKLKFARFDSIDSLDARVISEIAACLPRDVSVSRPAGTLPKTSSLESPKLAVRFIPNILIEPHQDFYSKVNRVVLQRLGPNLAHVKENHALGSGFVRWNSREFCLVDSKKPSKVLAKGIVLNGKFPNNWYHWIVNILPKAMLINDAHDYLPEAPYLISESCRHPNFEASLSLVNTSKRPVFFIPDVPHLLEEAILVDSPSAEVKVVKGRRDLDWSNLGFFHLDQMEKFRRLFLSHVNPKLSSEGTRLFLIRGEGSSRPYNQDEVREVLESRGYLSVDVEQMTFLEQVKVFAEARVIVGVTGAQWTGALWTSSARCVYVVPKFLSGTSTFPKLGHFGGSQFFEFPLETSARSWSEYYGSPIESRIDLDALQSYLDHLEVTS